MKNTIKRIASIVLLTSALFAFCNNTFSETKKENSSTSSQANKVIKPLPNVLPLKPLNQEKDADPEHERDDFIDFNGRMIKLADKRLKLGWSPKEFHEMILQADSPRAAALLRIVGYGGERFEYNGQPISVWTRMSEDMHMGLLMVENSGDKTVNLNFEIVYTHPEDVAINNTFFQSCLELKPLEVRPIPVTAFGLYSQNFDLYTVTFYDDGTGPASRDRRIGSFSW